MPVMPQIYRLALEENEDPAQPNWFKWSWCKLSELATLINAAYGYSWSPKEIVERFGVCEKSPRGPTYYLILISMSYKTFAFPKNYDYSGFHDYDKLLVPAGWAKNVLFCMQHGATHLCVKNKELWAMNENDEPVMTWP